MQTIIWFAGICVTLYGLKFVFMVFKRLGSKDTINGVLDRMEKGMANAADKVAKGFMDRKKKKEERPIVTIR